MLEMGEGAGPTVPVHHQASAPHPPSPPPVTPPNTPVRTEAPHVPSAPRAGDALERITCEWCQGQNEKAALACWACGAPLDIRNLVSESGWREAPRIKDMTEIHFGASTCQVEGEIVPVAELNLGQGDAVFFEHHVLLWKDDLTAMSVMPMQGGIKRALAGMPFIIRSRTARGDCLRAMQRANWWSCPCTRAWNSMCASTHFLLATSHQLFLFAYQGLAQHPLWRARHVHGSLLSPEISRDCFCCMVTETYSSACCGPVNMILSRGPFFTKILR